MAALTAFSKHVQLEVPGCPQPVVNEAVLRACIEFCERTAIIEEKTTVDIVVDTAEYTPSFASGMVAHRLVDVKRDGTPLRRSSTEKLDSIQEDAVGEPSLYYLSGAGDIVFAPIPDAVETLDVKAVVKPSHDATEVPDALANHWMLVIAAGAKALLFSQKNTAWYDPNEAAAKARDFSQGIDKAITQKRAGRSGTPSRVQMRPAA